MRSLSVVGRVMAVLGLAGSSIAAELVTRDLVLRVEDLPANFTFHASGPGGTSSGDDHFSTQLGFVVGGRYSFAGAGRNHGFLAGVECALIDGGLSSGGGLQAGELRGMGGYGLALGNRWTVDACVRLGGGYGRLGLVDEQAFGRLDLNGPMYSWSSELGVHWQMSDDWRLAFAAGWRQSRYALKGGGVDLNLDNSGMVWVLGLEYVLSQTPGSLE